MSDTSAADAAFEAAKVRYAAERAKRLRPDGVDQYVELVGDHAELDRDPWTPPFERQAISEETTAVIVGAGFAGMLTAIDLKKRGIDDFRMVEKGGDFGGTWYWNRYPGCMCDVESRTYLPLLEETGYRPRELYASATEIFEYCQLMGRHFDIYPNALFQTEIADAAWDDEAGRWVVETTRGDVLRAKYFVLAGGILNKAKLPGIPGIESFEGHAFHTSRWDYDYTGGTPSEPVMDKLAGKRVGIIGTGATAVQAVPRLAETAEHLYVFQRTPSAVGARNNGPIDPSWYDDQPPGWHEARVENFTNAVTGKRPGVDLVHDGWTEMMWVNAQEPTTDPQRVEELERWDYERMQELRDRVDELVEDPATADALKPWYGKQCKRICFHDEYLQAFNRPNVTLVDTDGKGVQRVTADAVVVDDVEYEVDCLIFASGFEVTTDLDRRLGFDPKGRKGVALHDHWQDGPHTLHGILASEFPNMFTISIVQAGFGVNFVHFLGKSAQHVAWLIDTCEQQHIRSIEAEPEAEEEWLRLLFGVSTGMVRYASTCTPGYYNGEGVRTMKAARNIVYAGSLLDYNEHLVKWREAGDFPGARVERE